MILNHHRIIIVYSNNDVNIAIDLYLQYYVARTSEAALIAMLKIGHLQVLKWFSQLPVRQATIRIIQNSTWVPSPKTVSSILATYQKADAPTWSYSW